MKNPGLSDGTFLQIVNTAEKLHASARNKFFDRIKKAKSFKEIFEIIIEIEDSQKENKNEKDN